MSVFLGSELTAAERDPDTARFRVIPVPLERTVSYGAGTAGGPAAILEASDQLERLCGGVEICAHGIATEPAVACAGPLAAVMERIAARTQDAVAAGRVPVVLGGEHSLSYGAVQGARRGLGRPVGIIQIDAHADLRAAYQGEPHSHASVMHMLGAEGVPLAQFGVRALCAEEAARRNAWGVFHVDGERLALERLGAVDLPEAFPADIWVSFDVDGLDPSEMPATGTPVPGGLRYFQALSLVRHALRGRRLIGLDVVELAPIPGQPGWDFTAAQLTYALMSLHRA